LADLDIPVKRGTFIEFRNGMINISPIGRSCTYDERLAFAAFDEKNKVREKLVKELKDRFDQYGLQFSIGGQISIDVFPKGWDKTYCLKHLENEGFEHIHFFGDKTEEGGNDYEIYHHPKVIGHAVKNPEDTMAQLHQLFFKA
jgi:phosphomannomutase